MKQRGRRIKRVEGKRKTVEAGNKGRVNRNVIF